MRHKNDLLVLDLAPKLKRPLSPWNPLDYLRLLYWVFYFPQAITWYVETFGRKDILEGKTRWNKYLNTVRYDHAQRNLIIMGHFLTLCVPILLAYLLELIGFNMRWTSIAFGVTIGLASGWGYGVAVGHAGNGVVFSVIIGVWVSMMGGININMTSDVKGILVNSMLSGGGLGIFFSALMALSETRGVVIRVAIFVSLGISIGVFCGLIISVVLGIANGLAVIIGFSLGGCMVIRPDAYVFNLLQWTLWKLDRGVSPFPLIGLSTRLQHALTYSTTQGIANIHQLLRYTHQLYPARNAINAWLAQCTSAQLISEIDRLSQGLTDWYLIRFIPFSLKDDWWFFFLDGLLIIPKRFKQPIYKRLNTQPRLDAPMFACCAGYWALYEQDLHLACKAFALLRNIPHGEGLYRVALALQQGLACTTLSEIGAWSQAQADWIPHSQYPPLRTQTYEIFQYLQQVATNVYMSQHSASRLSQIAAWFRSIRELVEIVDILNRGIYILESLLLKKLVIRWSEIVIKAAGEAGQMAIVKPVRNPFVAGNPVSGKLFVGREDVLARLEELWGQDLVEHPPSVVLFGHRRMGKTSILQNLAAHRFGNGVQVAYFSAQSTKSVRHSGELLHALATVLFDSLQPTLPGLAEPDLAEYRGEHYAVFNRFGRFLQTVRQRISAANPPTRVILTIDEFEMIEESICNGYIDPSLIDYLRTVIQTHTWLVLALAGLHTLKEMSADYWHPLFASVTPIHIDYLSPAAATNLLANPSDDFELDVTHEVANHVYALTHGQPFLTQLIGSYLVRRYNQQVFEQQQPRALQFTLADVDSVIEDPEFYHQGNYYFNGIWDQARSGAAGQLAVLQALAHAPQPLPTPDLLAATGLSPAVLQPALDTLVNHDVIRRIGKAESEGAAYAIIVPLTRRWVANKVPPII